ncbi:MAG: DUF938 domain-containing protein [Parvularculaceae bacterium]|nr:DUF938 domain-containing protein [Parvularculaceae bacterium]
MSGDARIYSPSSARNRDFIRDAFLKHMPTKGVIVEVGSGSGEHCIHIAAAAPHLYFLPGDPDEASRASIAAWIAESALDNISQPHDSDVTQENWRERFSACDGVLSINMIHIAPFAAAKGLFAGAASLLKDEGRLFLYGPFKRDGAHTAPTNEAFDQWLKGRDSSWGVRDLDREIAPLANRTGFKIRDIVEMPANNLSVVFSKY